jgi:murein L,D-transpeptidase YcbB/YkuD
LPELPPAAAAQLRDAMVRAPEFGLRSEDYLPSDGALPDPAAAARFLHDLHYGRVDPRAAGFELPEERTDLDVARVLSDIAGGAEVPAAIAALEPRFHHYGLLKDALARYRALAANPHLTDLPDPGARPLKRGDAYAGAAALRRLLGAEGDLLGPAPRVDVGAEAPAAPFLDSALQTALRNFQDRHGLPTTGSLDRGTFAALTTPMAPRVRQIELALERVRWLPPFDTPPIIVNIPQFELFAFRTTDDRAADIIPMPVIVGKTYPRMRTPVFMGSLRYLEFRPFWNVPRSILLREMLPKLRANPAYLDANHLEIVDGESDAAPVVAASPENIAALAAGRLRLRQRPGPDNALGPVKFVFPNAHDVYLHGTSAPGLFRESRRTISHGCIRVADPVGLAAYALRNTPGDWTPAKIEAAMADGASTRVDLATPITVIVFYSTALATEAGRVLFFDDVYGHDARLEALLGMAAR